jgi:DMSO/TMAO reductase YedYZ molybdopterin-dependent catalytic subunit
VLCLSLQLDDSYGQEAGTVAKTKTTLSVRGEVSTPLQLASGDLARMDRRTVKAKDQNGREAVYEGVLVADILKKAGAKQGKELRGELLATYLLVEASDGYRVVFAMPELDPAFTDRIVLLADRRDGKPLDDRQGPFRIVVPDEKRPARWVRQVVSLTVRSSVRDRTSPERPGR